MLNMDPKRGGERRGGEIKRRNADKSPSGGNKTHTFSSHHPESMEKKQGENAES